MLVNSLKICLYTWLVCCGMYTLVIFGFAQLLLPGKAAGSLVRNEQGTVIGSSLVAQKFEHPQYLWPRPSAVDYNAAGAGGSNLGPNNPKIAERAKERLAQLYPAGIPQEVLVPADLLTTSGGGLDPHITLASALMQAPRIAGARRISAQHIEAALHSQAEAGLVNVLLTNLALDTHLPLQQGGVR